MSDIRPSLGLLVVALLLALVGWFFLRIDAAQDFGGLLVLAAIVVALAGLVRLALALLRSPQRD